MSTAAAAKASPDIPLHPICAEAGCQWEAERRLLLPHLRRLDMKSNSGSAEGRGGGAQFQIHHAFVAAAVAHRLRIKWCVHLGRGVGHVNCNPLHHVFDSAR